MKSIDMMNTREELRLERRKYVLLRFLSIAPETLGRLKFIIGDDRDLTEAALRHLVQEGKVCCKGRGGMYFLSAAGVSGQ